MAYRFPPLAQRWAIAGIYSTVVYLVLMLVSCALFAFLEHTFLVYWLAWFSFGGAMLSLSFVMFVSHMFLRRF